MALKAEFPRLLQQVAAEKNLPRAAVREAMEAALALAYRQLFREPAAIAVHIDEQTSEIQIVRLDDAGAPVAVVPLSPVDLGRIGAFAVRHSFDHQLVQAEARHLQAYYESRLGQLVRGVITRPDPTRPVALVQLDRIEAILPPREQVPHERYLPGRTLTVLLKAITLTPRGLQVVVSRADPDMVRALLLREVPELAAGDVVIGAIAREPGVRTKVAIAAAAPAINPVAACIGLRGARIRALSDALGTGEAIDILPWHEDRDRRIGAALGVDGPIQVTPLTDQRIRVGVPSQALSLAIGRQGSNVRLAAQLLGLEIDLVATAA